MATQRTFLVATAIGVGLVGAGVVTYRALAPKPKKKVARGSGTISDLPAPDDFVPLEPWEEEAAAFVPPHDGAIDDPVGPSEQAIGTGRPEDFLLPSVLDSQLLGSSDAKAWKILDPLKDPELAPKDRGVPFAPVGAESTWPVLTKHSGRLLTSYRSNAGWHGYSGRAFAAERQTSEGQHRGHAGVDLFAREDDVVVAPEDGVILTILPFHHGTWSVYLLTSDDRIINLGEVKEYSWRDFGVSPGDQVIMGQPLATIGLQSGGSTMLHYEIYDGSSETPDEMIQRIRNGDFQWLDKDNPPIGLYDPTAQLLTAASRTYRRETGIELAEDDAP